MVYSILIDFILILIILSGLYKGFKTGFLSSVIFVIGSLVSIFVSIKLSSYISDFILNNFMRDGLIEKVTSMMNLDTLSSADIQSSISSFIESLPNAIRKSLEIVMGNLNNYIPQIQQDSFDTIRNIPIAIVDTIISPVILMLLNLISSLILFGIFAGLVRIISSWFSNFYKVPILGGINSILGGLIGLAQSAIWLYIISVSCKIFIIVTSNQMNFLNENIISNTFVMKYIYEFVNS